ncbi:hypothetical protein KY290_028529 [Solanum tuberosum]|uniref:Uncharacterized protein n=1 Tax=Solanum tuberosum TaxID=4113 RepID=A0ABQ7UI66_SOLTU|nr:hypothetical protein KY290_028529 [Solanum tuberosum]
MILLPRVTYSYVHHCGGEDDRDTSIFRYFILPRHKKKESNKSIYRVVGENLGTWKKQDKGKRVMCNQRKPLNMIRKKSLYYEFNFVVDLTEALLDHEPLKDRLDAIRECKSTLLLDQQS